MARVKSRIRLAMPLKSCPPKWSERAGAKHIDFWQLESVAQADAWTLARINTLINREPTLAAELELCEHRSGSTMILCSRCALQFRGPIIQEVLQTVESRPGIHEWATIFLEAAPQDCLSRVSVKHALDRLRQNLRRSGFQGSALIGAVEVSWLARDRVWILHVHVVALGVPDEAWDCLEEKLAHTGRADALDVDELNDPECQISYSIKFVTYHRPGKNRRNRRARAYPLPPDRLAELARWWSQRQFSDLIFLYGARRRGGRITLEV